MGTHEAPLLRPSQHGAAAGCKAGPSALRSKLWVPKGRHRYSSYHSQGDGGDRGSEGVHALPRATQGA